MARGCKCDPDDVSQLQCQRDPKPNRNYCSLTEVTARACVSGTPEWNTPMRVLVRVHGKSS